MTWLVGGGYYWFLSVHTLLLLIFTIWGMVAFWYRRERWPRLAALSLALLLLSALNVWSRAPRPSVYYDEFFYAAIGQDLASFGIAEPLTMSGFPPVVQRQHCLRPPYPIGWPFLISWHLPSQSQLESLTAQEPSAWERAVEVGRFLQLLLPLVLFFALSRRFSWPVAAVAAALLTTLPAVQRLTQCASAEGAALFSLALAYWAYCEWRNRPNLVNWLWAVTAATWMAEMRPEGLLWCLMLLGLLGCDSRRPRLGACLGGAALALCLLLPPLMVLGLHNPDLDHHFEAIPRPGLTMTENRLGNLYHNALALCDNHIWPLALSLLALGGSCASRPSGASLNWWRRMVAYLRTEQGICLASATAITVFLSWYPFGDYDCAYSEDTWRFTYHLVLPALILSAYALEAACSAKVYLPKAVVIILLIWTASSWLFPNARLEQRHSLEHQWDLAQSLRRECPDTLLVAEYPEYMYMLRFGAGVPAVLSPVAAPYPANMAVFEVCGEKHTAVPDMAAWDGYEWTQLAVSSGGQPQASVSLVGQRRP